MREILGALAARQNDCVTGDALPGKAVAQVRQVMARDRLVSHDDGLAPPQQRQHPRAGFTDQIRADENVVSTITEFDPQRLYGLAGRCSRGGSACHCLTSVSGAASGGREARGVAARAAITRVAVSSTAPSPLSMI